MDLFFRRFRRKPTNWIGVFLAAGVILISLAGKLAAPYDPLAVDTANRFKAPQIQNLLGTDNLGRDVASRTIAGTQLALQSCLVILGSATLVGTLIGLISGYYGGIVDEILMRIGDIFIAFPGLVLALAIAAALGPNLTNAMIAISAVWWPPYARLVRGQVLQIKQNAFIDATISLGSSNARVIFNHILPNILTPLLIQITSDIGPALVTTSSLSFIGMGAQPPTPEWGSMVSEGRKYILDYWWISTFPGAAILLTVLVFNSVGESMRKALAA
jgi:peptide/nickel transport system permease protein